MAITNYNPPHSELHQQRENIQSGTVDNNNVLIAGPQYEVLRYTSSTPDSSGQELVYDAYEPPTFIPDFEPDAKLDPAATKAFVRDGYKLVSPDMDASVTNATATTFTFPSPIAGAGRPVSWTRDAVPGDYVAAIVSTGDMYLFNSKIEKITGPATSQTIGALVPTVTGGTVNSAAANIAFGTTYIIRVVSATSAVVTDSAGRDTYAGPTSSLTAIPLGTSGVTVTLVAANSPIGSTYSVSVAPASFAATPLNTVHLQSSVAMGGISFAVTAGVCEKFTGEIPSMVGSTPVITVGETAADGIVVDVSAAGILSASSSDLIYVQNSLGRVFIQTRGLVAPLEGESYLTLTSVSDIDEQLGGYDQLNDLGYAAYSAMTTGNEYQPVYAVRTDGSTAEALASALERTKHTDIFYALTSTIDAAESAQTLKDHCNEMSDPKKMRWRVAYVPTASPGMYGAVTQDPSGSDYTGKVLPGNTSFKFDELNLSGTTVAAGDKLLLNFSTVGGNTTYDSYEILSVQPSSTVTLKTSVVGIPANVSVKAEVWKSDTTENITQYLESLATSLDSERIRLVWCHQPLVLSGASYVDQSMSAIAANMAALRSTSAQHKPLTRSAVASVVAAPAMYTRFTEAQLNRIAAAGVWIIQQDMSGGEVYVRHQLTTGTTGGLMTQEDSCVTNYDQVCYGLKVPLNLYTGKRNIDDITTTLIRNNLRDVMLTFAQTSEDPDLGPPVIAFDNAQNPAVPNDVFVGIDPNARDRYIAKVRMTLPTPNNGVRLYTFAATWDGSTVTIETL